MPAGRYKNLHSKIIFLQGKTVKDVIIKVMSNKYSPKCIFKDFKQNFAIKEQFFWTPSAFGHPLMCF